MSIKGIDRHSTVDAFSTHDQKSLWLLPGSRVPEDGGHCSAKPGINICRVQRKLIFGLPFGHPIIIMVDVSLKAILTSPTTFHLLLL